MKKLLRVFLNRQEYRFEEVPEKYRGLGGRGLTSAIVAEEVSPRVDPLSPDNKLVLAPGLLAGTPVPNNGRLSVGAKSPLTGTIKEANAGGAAAHKLARLGIQAIVLEGKAQDLTLLKVGRDGVAFLDGEPFRGMGNYRFIEKMKEDFGEGVAVISIGPAGEKECSVASVSVTTPDFHVRMASRGGLGAVMGAKMVKGLVIDDAGSREVEVSDKEALKAAATDLARGIGSHPLIEGLRQLGTPILVMMINAAGALPTRNYSSGQFEHAEAISGERLAELTGKRPGGKAIHRCMDGCIISCSNIVTDEKGEMIVSGLEYETIGLVGSNCAIGDLDSIARINRLCNDLGVDTMEVGGAIAVAMEAKVLPWGDGKGALSLVGQIPEGAGTGGIVGSGCAAAGRQLGVSRIPVVKGQCLAAYDPRVLKGTGTTYATSTMGADHTCGNALPSPANPDYNPAASTGQGPVSAFLQQYFAAIDTLGLCLFASLPLLDMPELQKTLIACVSAATGESPGDGYLTDLGASVLRRERRFNEEAGFSSKDDRLPEFFAREPLPPSGLVFDVPDQELDGVHSP